MKSFLAVILILSAFNAYAGAVRDKVVRDIEQLLLYIPKALMKDRSKGEFLWVLHNEITPKDELVIMETYKEVTSLAGMEDPLKLVEYVKAKDKDALKRMENQMELEKKEVKVKPAEKEDKKGNPLIDNNPFMNKEMKEKLKKIKESREYAEELLNTD